MKFPSFKEFFKAIYGYDPYKWQCRMAEDFCSGKWDKLSVLSMMTATGKTAILVAWLYSLARNLHEGGKRTIPIRCFYVTNRRLLTDAAYDEGQMILKAFEKDDDPILKPVITALKKLGSENPLVVAKMRGGLIRHASNKWLMDGAYLPTTPALVSCTMDQFGSGMLMRSYSVGERLRPIFTAMMAIDSLVVADESHLSTALVQTLREICQDHRFGDIPPSRVVEMSATTGTEPTYDITEDPLLLKVKNASRPITLLETKGEKSLVKLMVQKAVDLLDLKHKFIVIYVNTVKRGRMVFNAIPDQKGKGQKAIRIRKVFLTGRNRPFDRDALVKKYLADRMVGKRNRDEEEYLVLVSTQSGESGINLTADGMVSEIAPLDNLIQRFGRLIRMGELDDAQGFIVSGGPNVRDPIYEDRPIRTFNHLVKHSKDMVVTSLEAHLDDSLFAKRPETPKITPEIIDLLPYTNPSVPVDVTPYIHGIQENQASSFSMVYRADIDPKILWAAYKEKDQEKAEESRKMLEDSLKQAPPHTLERIELPLSVRFGYLTDIESSLKKEDNWKPDEVSSQLCIRRQDWKVIRLRDVQAGNEVFVPTSVGHLDEFGWNPESVGPAIDIYEECQDRIIRLHPRIHRGFKVAACFETGMTGDHKFTANGLLYHLRGLVARATEDRRVILKRIYDRIKEAIKADTFTTHRTGDKRGLYFRITSKKPKNGKLISLDQHQKEAAEEMRKLCENLGFSAELTKICVRACRHHDEGKADPRNQRRFYYPRPFNGSVYLAKSIIYVPSNKMPKFLPRGWRHEIQSAVIVAENNLDKGVEDKELLRHLIASHHGYCRAFYSPINDKSFQFFERDGIRSGESYVKNGYNWEGFKDLNDRYGPWGLVFLEALVRLVDYKVSNRHG